MSSKSKLIIAIILLAAGAGLVPTGFFLNQYLIDEVYEGVPEAMLKIQDDAVPSLEDQIPGLATPDVLLGIEAEALMQLESQLPGLATPDVLLGIEAEALLSLETQFSIMATPNILLSLKAEIEAKIPAMINCTTAANVMNQTIYGAIAFYGSFLGALNGFMNDQSWSTTTMGMMPINGISEVMTGGLASLGYTAAAQQALMIDGISIPTVADVPGIINDTALGTGVCGFLDIYNASLYNYALNQTIQLLYNASWNQLSALAGYLMNYLFPLVPIFFFANYGITVTEAENYGFYYQWANGTLVPDGIDLSLFMDTYDQELKGLEAGIPTPTGIANLTTIAMWTPSNPLSFVNETGIFIWLNTSYQALITGSFGINVMQYSMVLGWLSNFISNITPLLFYEGIGQTIPEVAQLAFYEQWANGTIQGQPMLPTGFLSQLDPSFAGPPYFEVGLPIPSNFSFPLTIALWNESDPDTFVNMGGIEIWLGAVTGDMTNITYLATTFGPYGLTVSNLTNILLPWLGAFYLVRIPQLLLYETGHTIPELAQLGFYEQWANGTIQGKPVLPTGFLSQLDPPIDGPPYFEVGLPTPSGITLGSTMELWNVANSYSFVNPSGIEVWLGAVLGNTTLQTLLQVTFSLSSGEMLDLLAWLDEFISDLVPLLLLYETGFTVAQLAQFAFYEQWANGTINGLPVLPEGFLSERDPPIYGPPYFEVGLTEGATGLTILQTMALWNEASEYSLVTVSGINKWYKARPGNTIYDTLKLQNGGISDVQMAQILDWLPQFRDIIVNKLAKDDRDLPMEPYDLGNTLLISLGAGGGALAALGVVMLILSRRS